MPDATLIPDLRAAVSAARTKCAGEHAYILPRLEGWRKFALTVEPETKLKIADPLIEDYVRRRIKIVDVETAMANLALTIDALEQDGMPTYPKKAVTDHESADIAEDMEKMALASKDVELRGEAATGVVKIMPGPQL